MKTQKGITLIALIITIIVMLILVGVSVSVALNTGLFKAAQGVAKNTEAEKVNEIKLSEGTVNIGGEEVDISNIENINAALEKQKLKEQEYKFIAIYDENTFECNVKGDTTFNELDALYDEITVDEDGYVKIFDDYYLQQLFVWLDESAGVHSDADKDIIKGDYAVFELLDDNGSDIMSNGLFDFLDAWLADSWGESRSYLQFNKGRFIELVSECVMIS